MPLSSWHPCKHFANRQSHVDTALIPEHIFVHPHGGVKNLKGTRPFQYLVHTKWKRTIQVNIAFNLLTVLK